MQINELTVEVRNANLERVGQLTPPDLAGAMFVTRYNNVGSWRVELSPTQPLADVLRTPGSGLIVTGPTGVIISGPTRTAKLEQTTENNLGVWVIEGTDDSVILIERLAYPFPSETDVTLQTNAYDTRFGLAETVIKGYVQDNISAAALTSRSIPNLLIEPDELRGEIVTASARFSSLQDLIYPVAQTGKIGYDVLQSGSDLEFLVYEPKDLTGTIRMDLDNGKLSRTDYSYVNPQATRAIVGGSGEAESRKFYEGVSPESILAESTWGRRIEVFLDARSTEIDSELDQKAQELLVDNGKTIVNLAVTPSDDVNMRYGYDWSLGDLVTVVINQIEASSVVNEVGIAIGSDGVRIAATLGTPNATDFESRLIQRQLKTENRVSNLERTVTGYGINTNYDVTLSTDGDQPVFSSNSVSGTFNRSGNMVHIQIEALFANVTDFGTGQYQVNLPKAPLVTETFGGGTLTQDSTGRRYHVRGSMVGGIPILYLWVASLSGQRIFDQALTFQDPITITTADKINISGTYEIEG